MPPTDVHDAHAWDKYWNDQFTRDLTPWLSDIGCRDQSLVDLIISRGATTVLCVGCGNSQEPRALANAGLNVTALDLSAAALRWAQDRRQQTDDWVFFDRPMLRSGGTLQYVVGDLMDPTACPGPFDVIIERSCVQPFGNDIAAAMQRLTDRLAGQGIFRSNCHAGWWRPGEPLEHPLQSWLEAEGWSVWSGAPGAPPAGRFAWLSMSTG